MDPLGLIEVRMFARSRKTTKIFFLIVRCIDTGCISGVMMESMENKYLINGLLRLQLRFGKISKISKDQGANLLELNRLAEESNGLLKLEEDTDAPDTYTQFR